jgi:hypothetical protein
MPWQVLKWPGSVYPGEVDEECPEARGVIDVLILRMGREGPSPKGYSVKNLGKRMEGLWQINLRVGRQVRILYAPYELAIVIFRIHKKGSSQEQKRAYDSAKRRKQEYDNLRKQVQDNHGKQSDQRQHDRNRTIH